MEPINKGTARQNGHAFSLHLEKEVNSLDEPVNSRIISVMYEFLSHLGAEDGEGARQFSFHSVGIRVPPERQAYPHMLA